MLPLIRQKKDVIFLEKKTDERCKRLDVVLFMRRNGQYVLHRVLKVYDDGYWIVGDNCVRGETVAEEQVIGVLTAFKRGKKTVKVTDVPYRIFSHIWCDAYPVRFFALRCVHFVHRCLAYIAKRMKHGETKDRML